MAAGRKPGRTGDADPGGSGGGHVPDGELERRRRELGRSLEARGLGGDREDGTVRGGASGYGQAVRLSSEFIAGVGVGAGIGWLVDRFAGTSPFGLIVFLLLGFGAGVLNIMRATGSLAAAGSRASAKDGGDTRRD